ncbi:MAG: hypothetical protein HY420_02540 [Candidatus Kerfeldbacteria bacterium]|nr:hypothetical protein [Candidatus Kerfeldbacteria bacterium]
MIQTVTLRIGDRIYRVDNPRRTGSIKTFITKKAGGRPHRYAVVNVMTSRGIVEEHWRLDQCRLAD